MLEKHRTKFVRFELDGGNISLVEIIEDKHVKVRLEGAYQL